MKKGAEGKRKSGVGWRVWVGILLAGAIAVPSALAARSAWRFALADPQFTLSRERVGAVTIQGLEYTSRAKVQRIFATDFGRSVFAVPLEERRRRLQGIDWVEDASVARIWPDHLAVRIRERRPVAFVLLRSGWLLIDEQGVLLDPPARAQFTFPVLSGVGEDESEVERREGVRTMLEVENELGGQARNLSEVNVSDPSNIRIVAQVENRTLEFILGDSGFGRRYENFLSHYPEIKRRSPEVKTFDLRLDDRITAKE
jgi:cell division protein FtsQ